MLPHASHAVTGEVIRRARRAGGGEECLSCMVAVWLPATRDRQMAPDATFDYTRQRVRSPRGHAPMIISQTPYRVSFAGGGTDLPAFYRREYGAVLSTTIDQHIYVTIHRRFEPTTRVSYSRTEIASTLDEIQHELVREAMRLVEIDEPLEITTIGDVPAGTGMGSSSSLTVGLLTALYGYRHRVVSPRLLAEQACRIEIDTLSKPIGRQDQYAAAFGGVNYIRFNPDETVEVEPVPCRAETLVELEQRVLLIYTGQTRDANQILDRQSSATVDRLAVLRSMRDLADQMRHALAGEGDLDRFAALLHEAWELKRSLVCGISNDQIDEWYEAARRAGAAGGKLLGAGGGGFLLLIAPPWRHRAIREALGRPPRAVVPDRPDRQPEYLYPQLDPWCPNEECRARTRAGRGSSSRQPGYPPEIKRCCRGSGP